MADERADGTAEPVDLESRGTPPAEPGGDAIARDRDGRMVGPDGEPVVPTAASVRHADDPELEARRRGLDYPDELEGEPGWVADLRARQKPGGLTEEDDERARLERLNAKPAEKRQLPVGARRTMVRAAYDAIMRQWQIMGAGDVICRVLAERAGVDVETASAWLSEEARRRGDS